MKWILGIGIAFLGVASLQAEPVSQPSQGTDSIMREAKQRGDGDALFTLGTRPHKKRGPRGSAGTTNPCDAPVVVATTPGRGDRASRAGGAAQETQRRGKNGKGGTSSAGGAPADCTANPPVENGGGNSSVDASSGTNDNADNNSTGNDSDEGADGGDNGASDALDGMDLGEEDSLPDDVLPPVNPMGGNDGDPGPDPTGGFAGDGPNNPLHLVALDVPTDGEPNATIPEPASLALIGIGLGALGASRRRRY